MAESTKTGTHADERFLISDHPQAGRVISFHGIAVLIENGVTVAPIRDKMGVASVHVWYARIPFDRTGAGEIIVRRAMRLEDTTGNCERAALPASIQISIPAPQAAFDALLRQLQSRPPAATIDLSKEGIEKLAAARPSSTARTAGLTDLALA